jgi:hypothetical protein
MARWEPTDAEPGEFSQSPDQRGYLNKRLGANTAPFRADDKQTFGGTGVAGHGDGSGPGVEGYGGTGNGNGVVGTGSASGNGVDEMGQRR